jgi:hypothetical protein
MTHSAPVDVPLSCFSLLSWNEWVDHISFVRLMLLHTRRWDRIRFIDDSVTEAPCGGPRFRTCFQYMLAYPVLNLSGDRQEVVLPSTANASIREA